MTRLSRLISLLPVGALLFAATPALAASWQTGNYGGNLTMTYYVPDKVDANPALVLALHFCSGNETSGQNWFQSFADQYGFVIISPRAPGNCWDASPGRSGDRAEIAKMIDWAIANQHVDATRVYSAGASSGACMSETMLASYPDKIAAASVLAGVPVGFWMGGNTCGVCSQQVASTDTPKSWGDKVRGAAPADYTGSRGRIQLFHAIQDQYLGSGNLKVEVSQWTDALGVTGDGMEEADQPRSGWTRTSYTDSTGAVIVQSNWWGSSPPMSHDLTSNINPPLWNEVVSFFGLDQDAAAPGGTGPAGTTAPGASTGGTDPSGGVGGAGPVGNPTPAPPGMTAPMGNIPPPAPVGTPAPMGATIPPPAPVSSSTGGVAAPTTSGAPVGNIPPPAPVSTPAPGNIPPPAPVGTPAPSAKPPVGATPSASVAAPGPGVPAGAPAPTGTTTTPAGTDDEGGCALQAPVNHGTSGAWMSLLGAALGVGFARRRYARK